MVIRNARVGQLAAAIGRKMPDTLEALPAADPSRVLPLGGERHARGGDDRVRARHIHALVRMKMVVQPTQHEDTAAAAVVSSCRSRDRVRGELLAGSRVSGNGQRVRCPFPERASRTSRGTRTHGVTITDSHVVAVGSAAGDAGRWVGHLAAAWAASCPTRASLRTTRSIEARAAASAVHGLGV